MAVPVRFFELNTGAKLPSVGLGTYAMVATTIEQAIKVLLRVCFGLIPVYVFGYIISFYILVVSIQIGYRHIDCASIYGNEKEVNFCYLQDFFFPHVKH